MKKKKTLSPNQLQRHANGLCFHCGEPLKTKWHCAKHAARQNDLVKAHRKKLVDAGICIDCKVSHTSGLQRCKSCAIKKWPPAIQHAKGIERRYGISIECYDQMVITQNGSCAICQKPEKPKKLSVDHDHSTGEVRGLLCDPCNHGLGLFKDNVNLLQRAIEYLKAPNKIIF